MKKLLALLLIAPLLSIAQQKDPEKGTLKYLDFKDGFKNFTLGSPISTFSGKVKFMKNAEDSTAYYEVVDNSQFSVGDIPITTILIRTFKSKVLDVIVYFNKEKGAGMFSVFIEAYGTYSEQPNRFMNAFTWTGKSVELSFDFESSRKEPQADFRDLILHREYLKFRQENSKKASDEL